MFDGLKERIGRRRFENRMAERQIDDVDIQHVPVRDGELNRANYVIGRALSLRVQNPEPNQASGGCHTYVATGSKSRDVRPVAVRVRRRRDTDITLRKVVEGGDACAEVEPRRDARVDDR